VVLAQICHFTLHARPKDFPGNLICSMASAFLRGTPKRVDAEVAHLDAVFTYQPASTRTQNAREKSGQGFGTIHVLKGPGATCVCLVGNRA
jgi:hypothetical protein